MTTAITLLLLKLAAAIQIIALAEIVTARTKTASWMALYLAYAFGGVVTLLTS